METESTYMNIYGGEEDLRWSEVQWMCRLEGIYEYVLPSIINLNTNITDIMVQFYKMFASGIIKCKVQHFLFNRNACVVQPKINQPTNI
jgi:hypothetical protein